MTQTLTEFIKHHRDAPSVISKIVYQKKDKLRASIFIGEEFGFGINVLTIEKFRLRKGDELAHQLLVELHSFDERVSAKRIASKFLNRRRRTEKEVRDKLRTEKFEQELIDEIIPDLKNTGLINDEEFAFAFIHDKRLSKPISSRQIQNELRKRGVAKEVIENVLNASESEETEEDRASEAAMKKWNQLLRREGDEKKRRQKLTSFLGSRGFEYDVIKKVMLNIAGNINEEEYE